MSEYIITDEQIAENRRIHGKKLLVMPVIVRCRDCANRFQGNECCFIYEYGYEPDFFCAMGKREEA